MISEDKITEIFCIADDFCKEFEQEYSKMAVSASAGRTRRRKRTMSDAEVITVLIAFHFNTYRNFKHYYLGAVCITWKHLFPKTFSYNRFVEVMPRCFAALVMFLQLFGKLYADKGYISQSLFGRLWDNGVHIVTGLRTNMKQKLMPIYDKIMLRKRSVIESVNDMLKNTAQLVHSRHRSFHNFIMNLLAAIGAYCFYNAKPHVNFDFEIPESDGQLTIW